MTAGAQVDAARRRPGLGRSALFLARSCSVRFAAYYWCGFMVGFAINDSLSLGWALGAIPLWLAYCIGTESVNRIADREADLVNRPERTHLVQEFGWGRMKAACVIAWLVFAAGGAVMLWQEPSPVLAAVLVLDVFIAICYSIGPAFKRRRVLSVIALITPLIMPMVTGWAVHGDLDSLLSPTLPAAAVLAAFSVGLSGIKDITDVEGDEKLDYSSLWIALMGSRSGARVYALVGAPFVVLTAFTSFGQLPWQALLVFPLVAVSTLVVVAAAKADEPEDRGAAREVMHQYTFYFLVLFLAAAVPGTATALVAVIGIGYWLFASRLLHWSGGLTLRHLRLWWGLFSTTRQPAVR
ncbi:UbiA family prenyltransferase [Streptomyces sp. NA04227]|uniref:UbiA family prenyltransferase n=1 Tax=Streptomyces sp. NA04227 TaxID=2742136 RepID=UPI000A205752|nr:UbiA family prenyltransferase [Streptomyces sp. NA04227]ARM20264.1 SauA [Streptomyces sp.]QKW07490.1 UbiA family prenyltransferase [Streptomyces sp. NA04227]